MTIWLFRESSLRSHLVPGPHGRPVGTELTGLLRFYRLSPGTSFLRSGLEEEDEGLTLHQYGSRKQSVMRIKDNVKATWNCVDESPIWIWSRISFTGWLWGDKPSCHSFSNLKTLVLKFEKNKQTMYYRKYPERVLRVTVVTQCRQWGR